MIPSHLMQHALSRSSRRLRRFRKDEEGSFSVEAVIWMPIFAMMLGITMNISTVFFTESQMLRVVQDGNRAYSLGRMANTTQVEEYIAAQLAYTGAALTVTTSLADGNIVTMLQAPATDLMPLNFMTGVFASINVTVSAQHIVEF